MAYTNLHNRWRLRLSHGEGRCRPGAGLWIPRGGTPPARAALSARGAAPSRLQPVARRMSSDVGAPAAERETRGNVQQQGVLRCFALVVLLASYEEVQDAAKVDFAVVVNIELAEGFVNLLGGEFLAPGDERVPEAVAVDETLAFVEGLEGLDDDVIIVSLTGLPAGEHAQEHGEVDGSRGISQHLVQLLVVDDLADDVEAGADVALVEDTVLVSVHHLEAFLELIDLLLGEAGEDAASRLL